MRSLRVVELGSFILRCMVLDVVGAFAIVLDVVGAFAMVVQAMSNIIQATNPDENVFEHPIRTLRVTIF